MIRALTLLFALGLPLKPTVAHEHVPVDTKAFNQEVSTTAFIKHKLHHHFILGYRYEDNEQLDNNRTYLLGYRYKFSKQIRLLAFYRQSYGLRHNEDWINPGARGWRWRDTGDRRESIYGLGMQYKYVLDEARKHVLKVRGNYLFNTFNDQQDLELTVGHLFAYNAKVMSLLQGRLNLPVNYARQTLNYYSLYYGLLYSLGPQFAIGPQFKYMIQRWTEPISFLGTPDGEAYEVENRIVSLGLVLNYYPNLFD